MFLRQWRFATFQSGLPGKQHATTLMHPGKKISNPAAMHMVKRKERLCRNHVVFTKDIRTNTVPRAGTPLSSMRATQTTFMMDTCTIPIRIMSMSM